MNRGEIWLIDLNPSTGAEIKKVRPAIIINNEKLGKLPLKIIIPVTDWKPNYSVALWMVQLIPDKQNNLTKLSAADTFQIRSVSEERFVKRIGSINEKTLERISLALILVLKINLSLH